MPESVRKAEEVLTPADYEQHRKMDQDTVLVCWAYIAQAKWWDKYGRDPTKAEIKGGLWRRMMDDEPCWDCGARRENVSFWFCNECVRRRSIQWSTDHGIAAGAVPGYAHQADAGKEWP